MSPAIVSYDQQLPEIPDRRPEQKPDRYLIRTDGGGFGVADGRRPSRMLLVNRLREAVDRWREDGYPGASDVTARLLSFWFDEEHLVGDEPFRYYFGQREAIETLIFLTEIQGFRDAKPLIDAFAETPAGMLIDQGIQHQTTMDGARQIRRYIPDLKGEVIQTLPPADLARYAMKMATGSGKTVVMAMAAVWSYFHKSMVPGSPLSRNFLIVAPNVIVYQRLERDFASNRIFYQLPLVPPEWSWTVKPIMRGESGTFDPAGTLVLTNVQQLYESREQPWTPANAVDALLGRKPVKDLSSTGASTLDRLKALPDLMVLNDEAHHVHDEDLQWNKTLMGLHQALPRGFAAWLDFSATPKDQNGTFYPWIICDYPLAQAVEDRIVKAPLIVHQIDRVDPDKVTVETVIEAYGDWIQAAVARWREHHQVYASLGQKPVLFVMAESNRHADVIGGWLRDTKELGFKSNEVLVIHTNSTGEVTEKDLDVARRTAASIDDVTNPVKVVVSVLMLREGWDVRSVSVILGLRPFTAKAKILPEQAVGRGLRLMQGISPDQTQTLEVMGTAAFEDFVRELEKEGLGIPTTNNPPPPPIKIEPIQERYKFDIAIPLTKPVYTHEYRKLSTLQVSTLEPLYSIDDTGKAWTIRLAMQDAMTATEVHRTTVEPQGAPITQEALSSIVSKTERAAAITGQFRELYPLVRSYVRDRCFGGPVDIDDLRVRQFLSELSPQQKIAGYLAKEISKLMVEQRDIEFEDVVYLLSQTPTFLWRRKHVQCDKTIFNYVASYNDFETRFAQFLERAPDVVRFAALAEHFTRFRVDYISERGAIKFYYPDFVAVQQMDEGAEVNWILETKGWVHENTVAKDRAITDWCERVTTQTGQQWRYMRINQPIFDGQTFPTMSALAIAVLGRNEMATLF